MTTTDRFAFAARAIHGSGRVYKAPVPFTAVLARFGTALGTARDCVLDPARGARIPVGDTGMTDTQIADGNRRHREAAGVDHLQLMPMPAPTPERPRA